MPIKKHSYITTILLLIICVAMCAGCGGKKNDQSGEMEEKYVFEEITLYDKESSEISLSEKEALTYCDGILYYATASRTDDIPDRFINSYDIKTGETKVLFKLEKGAWGLDGYEDAYINIAGMKVIGDSLMLIWQMDDESWRMGIDLFSMDGELKEEFDVAWPADEILIAQKTVIDSKGNSYVLAADENWEGYLVNLSMQGEVLDFVKMPQTKIPGGMALDSTGTLVTYEGIGLVNFYPGKLNNPVINEEFADVQGVYNGDESSLVYINNGGECISYDKNNDEIKPLFSWSDMISESVNIDLVLSIGDGCFVCRDMGDGFDDNSIKYGVISKKMVPKDDRTVVYLAGVDERSFVDFNKTGKDYIIEYVQYDYETYATDLYKDILSGNCPDIILPCGELDEYELVSSGIVRELNSFIEADKDMGDDFFVPGLLDALKIGDYNYYLGESFNIKGFVGERKKVGSYEDGITVDEFIELSESLDADMQLFGKTSKEGMAYALIGGNMTSYIDWETGKCSFDSEEFGSLLEFCAKFDNGEWHDVINRAYDVDVNKVLFCNADINGFTSMKAEELRYGGDGIFIGYPGNESSLKISTGGMAIASDAAHPEEAWDYIKYCINTEKEMSGMVLPEFPVSMERFNKQFEKEKKNAEGSVTNGVRLSKEDFSEKDIDTVINLIKRSKYDDTNSVYYRYGIIREDIESYFVGEHSLEETVNIINDRMTKYVNERK